MAGLVSLREAAPPISASPRWHALLELGFRPLYLCGCVWAIAAVGLWIFAPQWLSGRLTGIAWHAHEMLWGFVATIAVGFLLTAASNWTGAVTLRAIPLALLVASWCLARIGFLLPGDTAFAAAVLFEVLFFGGGAAALGKAIYGTRNRRNYGVPVLVFALGATDALFLWSAFAGDRTLLMQRLDAGLLCMAVIALLVARRVIPFFAMRAVPGLTIPMLTRSGQWQIAACSVAVAASLVDPAVSGMTQLAALGLGIAGTLALAQAVAWKPWAVRRVPLLWVLYVGYAGLGLGLVTAALHAAGFVTRAAVAVHVVGVAGFAVLVIGMVTRTALGHLGRPLRADRSMVASYALVIAAAVLRIVAIAPGPWTLVALHASAIAWIAAFGLYLWRFAPMLVRPRVDAPPAAAVRPPVRAS